METPIQQRTSSRVRTPSSAILQNQAIEQAKKAQKAAEDAARAARIEKSRLAREAREAEAREKAEQSRMLEEAKAVLAENHFIPIANDPDPKRRQYLENIGETTLTEFAVAIYGKALVQQLIETHGSLRKQFEDYAGDQCDGALVETPFEANKSNCWICGFTITNEPGFTNECEHVFPISQAIFFIDLYRGKKKTTFPSKLLKLEQDWSHEVCNQEKNDTHFLFSTGSGLQREWFVDKERIVKFLKDLSNTKRLGGSILKERIGANLDGWINKRTDAIQGRCDAILNETVRKCESPALFTLASLANCMQPLPTTPSPSTDVSKSGIKRTREQAGIDPTLTPVRTLGPFKAKGRRRTRKAKSRNRRTRKKKFTS